MQNIISRKKRESKKGKGNYKTIKKKRKKLSKRKKSKRNI